MRPLRLLDVPVIEAVQEHVRKAETQVPCTHVRHAKFEVIDRTYRQELRGPKDSTSGLLSLRHSTGLKYSKSGLLSLRHSTGPKDSTSGLLNLFDIRQVQKILSQDF